MEKVNKGKFIVVSKQIEPEIIFKEYKTPYYYKDRKDVIDHEKRKRNQERFSAHIQSVELDKKLPF